MFYYAIIKVENVASFKPISFRRLAIGDEIMEAMLIGAGTSIVFGFVGGLTILKKMKEGRASKICLTICTVAIVVGLYLLFAAVVSAKVIASQ